MTKTKLAVRIPFLLLITLVFFYMEKAKDFRSDFNELKSRFYKSERQEENGEIDSLSFYAKAFMKFNDPDWTFSERVVVDAPPLEEATYLENRQHVYDIIGKTGDEIDRKIDIIGNSYYVLFFFSWVMIYLIEDHILPRFRKQTNEDGN